MYGIGVVLVQVLSPHIEKISVSIYKTSTLHPLQFAAKAFILK